MDVKDVNEFRGFVKSVTGRSFSPTRLKHALEEAQADAAGSLRQACQEIAEAFNEIQLPQINLYSAAGVEHDRAYHDLLANTWGSLRDCVNALTEDKDDDGLRTLVRAGMHNAEIAQALLGRHPETERGLNNFIG
jgi:hypothetical protein